MDHSNLICRVCLQVRPSKCTLLEENVSANDELPKVCCLKCIRYLNFVEKMRRLLIRSDVRLRNVLNMDGDFRQLVGNVLVHREEKIEIKQDEMPAQNKSEHDFVELRNKEVSDGNVNVSIEEDSKTSDDVLENIISKISDDMYHCNVCNIDIHDYKECRSHKGKHMQRTCKICGVTTRSDNFFKHMIIHKLGQQVCHICGSKHKSFDGLRTHLFHFHNEKKPLYACEECGEKFRYSRGLVQHKRRVHLGFRPYQCDSCGKSFFQLGSLKMHVKLIHLKLREYPCDVCKKHFTTSFALKVHNRLHTHETPYMCDICSQGFRQLISLKKHLIKHQKDGTIETSTGREDRDEIVTKQEES